MSQHVQDVNDGNFATVVSQSEKPVLVDFWAAWCEPCRTLGPIIENVAERHAKSARVVKLNVDDNPSIVQRYGIQGIPTLILFQNGEEKERIVGVASEETISRAIDRHLVPLRIKN